jgi:DNA replication licensing factor MCM4
MSSFNNTPSDNVPDTNNIPSDNVPDTPRRYYNGRSDMLSSQLEPSSPIAYSSNRQQPGSPSRIRNRRSELSSTLLGDDFGGATSPLAYPSTPLRSSNLGQAGSNGPYDSPRTPRANTTFVRTPSFIPPQTPLNNSNRMGSSAFGTNMDTQESDPSLSVRLIWGTTVNIHEAMTSFRNFLNNFTLAHRKRKLNEPITEDDRRSFYPLLLTHIYDTNATNVNLDCRNLQAYPETHKLYDQLIKYPQEIIPLMDHTITEFYLSQFSHTDFNGQQLKVKRKREKERKTSLLTRVYT